MNWSNSEKTVTCPHCGVLAFTKKQKERTGPLRFLVCNNCGRRSTVEWRGFLISLIPGIILPAIGIIAFVFYANMTGGVLAFLLHFLGPFITVNRMAKIPLRKL